MTAAVKSARSTAAAKGTPSIVGGADNGPKLMSVFHAADARRVSYLLRRMPPPVSVKAVNRDLCRLLELDDAAVDACRLTDLTGRRVATVKALYRSTAVTFVLTVDTRPASTEPDATPTSPLGSLIRDGVFNQRTDDLRCRGDTPSWYFGVSTLILTADVVATSKGHDPTKTAVQRRANDKTKSSSIQSRRTNTRTTKPSSSQIKTTAEELLATLNLNTAPSAIFQPAESAESPQSVTNTQPDVDEVSVRKQSSGVREDTSIVGSTAATNLSSTPQTTHTNPTTTTRHTSHEARFPSQIDDQQSRIRRLQDQMTQGESFLDCVGRRRNANATGRVDVRALFGDGEQTSRHLTTSTAADRQRSAIRSWFTSPSDAETCLATVERDHRPTSPSPAPTRQTPAETAGEPELKAPVTAKAEAPPVVRPQTVTLVRKSAYSVHKRAEKVANDNVLND